MLFIPSHSSKITKKVLVFLLIADIQENWWKIEFGVKSGKSRD